MNKKICLAMIVGIAMAAIGYLGGQQPAGKTGGGKGAAEDSADVAAIKKAGQSLLKAYMTGDAAGMAAHWTENGEYFAEDGTHLRGRAEIQKAYTERFSKNKGPSEATLDVTSIRFPSKDTAIEEGYIRVRRDKDSAVSSKYSVLHVREGGKWLMALVREWPSDGVSLRDLDWLIGTWEAKKGDVDVHTTYEWWGTDKAFIRAKIALKIKGKTHEGFQMIGKDRATGQVRSWTFDVDGAFAEATWTREGKKWSQEAAAVLEDGSVLAQTNIMHQIDDNTFTFQSVERSVGGEDIDDIPPVRVTRVKVK